MNSNDFDSWNREAILRAALEYRDSSERYRSELVYTEAQLARVMGERELLRDENDRLRTMLAEITAEYSRLHLAGRRWIGNPFECPHCRLIERAENMLQEAEDD